MCGVKGKLTEMNMWVLVFDLSCSKLMKVKHFATVPRILQKINCLSSFLWQHSFSSQPSARPKFQLLSFNSSLLGWEASSRSSILWILIAFLKHIITVIGAHLVCVHNGRDKDTKELVLWQIPMIRTEK